MSQLRDVLPDATPPPGARERILAERDPVRLERWIARAVVCASVAELFVEGSGLRGE